MRTVTYKRKLKLTTPQQERLNRWIGTCRLVYNLALETRMVAWQKKRQVSQYELMKQLVALKAVDWIADVPSQSLQQVVERLERAYRNFFAGGGPPRWASKHRYQSITFKKVSVDRDRVRLPKIGWLKTFKDRSVEGQPKTATIIREQDGYYVCITSAVSHCPVRPASENQAVGLDMGLAHFATLSSGEHLANPRHFDRYQKQLRIENRALARKRQGSANWQKQKAKLAKLHAKIARVRKDFTHKQSSQLVGSHSLIAVEDLKVGNMARGILARQVNDVAWATLRSQLAYKCEWYGTRLVAVNPHYTSLDCSACGHRDRANRVSQAEFVCQSCGLTENADVNAAKNILRRGTAYVSQRGAVARA